MTPIENVILVTTVVSYSVIPVFAYQAKLSIADKWTATPKPPNKTCADINQIYVSHALKPGCYPKGKCSILTCDSNKHTS